MASQNHVLALTNRREVLFFSTNNMESQRATFPTLSAIACFDSELEIVLHVGIIGQAICFESTLVRLKEDMRKLL